MRAFTKALFVGCLASVSLSCLADENVGVALGGLAFGSDQALITREVVDISATRVSVDYDVISKNGQAVPATLTFALPRYDLAAVTEGAFYGEPSNFKMLVDGHSRPFETSIHSYANNKDITASLLKLGLTPERMAFLPAKTAPFTASQEKAMRTNGWLDGGQPAWTVAPSYLWRVTLSAKPVHVHLEYQPLPSQDDSVGLQTEKSLRQDFCADDALVAQWKKASMQADDARSLPAWRIDYAFNAYTLVQDLTVRVHPESARSLIAACLPSATRSREGTALVFHQSNISPRQVLQVYLGRLSEKLLNTDFPHKDFAIQKAPR